MFPRDEHDHTPQSIAERLGRHPPVNYLHEWVYGGIDGVVTTFAVVAGVAGADLSSSIVLIIAFANLLGDGFSMAAGCYSGTKTQEDNYERLRRFEFESIRKDPDGEKAEIRYIFGKKGFEGDILETIVETIAANRKIWVETMMAEEYGMTQTDRKALKAGLHTFFAFLICGLMPVLPFMFGLPGAFHYSMIMAGVTFFGIGAMKSFWSPQSWLRHGIETLTIGGIAAAIAYGTGYSLKILLG